MIEVAGEVDSVLVWLSKGRGQWVSGLFGVFNTLHLLGPTSEALNERAAKKVAHRFGKVG